MEKFNLGRAQQILNTHYPMSINEVCDVGYDGFTYSRVTGYSIFNGICVHKKEKDIYIFQEITILNGGAKNEK